MSTLKVPQPLRTPLIDIEGADSTPRGNATSAEVASAAGRRTWAAWAGRDSPSNSGQWKTGDLRKGFMNMFNSKIKQFQCGAASECPICFTVSLQQDCITLWCGCTVCRDCMKGWATSQVQGATVASDFILHCPVCRAVVRPDDAQKIMILDREVYETHHEKLIARALQSDPEFVNCTHCKGGGFVTPDCLSTRENERIEELARHAESMVTAFGAFCFLLAMICLFTSATLPLEAPVILLLVFAVLSEFCHQHFLAKHLKIMNAPFEVGCPNCENRFMLAREGDMHTDQWIRRHTRPCPRCTAPIEKRSGCNHMVCTSCQLRFCWACMRESSECGAFACHNGAPYGNASPFDREAPAAPRQPWRNEMVPPFRFLVGASGLLALLTWVLQTPPLQLLTVMLWWLLGAMLLLSLFGCIVVLPLAFTMDIIRNSLMPRQQRQQRQPADDALYRFVRGLLRR